MKMFLFQMLHTGKITFLELFQTYFPIGAPILGNVIESQYVIIVAWVSTHIIGIAISRN